MASTESVLVRRFVAEDVRPGSARDYRQAEFERDAYIAALGMAPEVKTLAGRYAATTSELRRWVVEDHGASVANAIVIASAGVR